jgi:2-polyprenyl-3-methyl-5-hydroxy-6-metoxy-1,4-benzoquinol methylase
MKKLCASCAKEKLSTFFKIRDVPVQSVINISTRNQALSFPRGSIALGFCDNCGFISNVLFDPTLLRYSSEYESTQSFSVTYNAFTRRQAKQLYDRYNLYGKQLIEIGCGNGEFLTLLCELGDNRGIGFDPAYKKGRIKEKKGVQVRFFKDFYSEKYAEYHADFVFCRMTLEHIPAPAEFVGMVRKSIGNRPDVIVFFQVPDVTRILQAYRL